MATSRSTPPGDRLVGVATGDTLLAGFALDPGIDLDARSLVDAPAPVRLDLARIPPYAGSGPERPATLAGSRVADRLAGDADDNRICGLDGHDRIWGRGGDDRLAGGGGRDLLCGGAGDDTLLGGYDSDRLIGGAGDDRLEGGAGDDVLRGGAGIDRLVGGAGIDTADYSYRPVSEEILVVALDDGESSDGGEPPDADTLSGIENVRGGVADELFAGDANANRLSGGGGDDLLLGGAGEDWLEGGDGDDTLHGFAFEDGDDGADQLDGGAGFDDAAWQAGDPFAGTATISREGDTILVRIGDAVDRVTGLELYRFNDIAFPDHYIIGAAVIEALADADAVLRGTEATETIAGGGNDEFLIGFGGADELEGGGGDDVIRPGDDAVRVDGGTGTDTIDFSGTEPTGFELLGQTLDLALPDPTSGGLDVAGIENAFGNLGDDTFMGSAGANRFEGMEGDDRLAGGAGDDVLNGGLGADRLELGEVSGTGNDLVDGGPGDDEAVLAGLLASFVIGVGPAEVTATDASGTDRIRGVNRFTFDDASLLLDELAAVVGGARLQQGAAAADDLVGTAAADVLVGAAGADTLEGGAGDDRLNGGEGVLTDYRNRFDFPVQVDEVVDTASYADATDGVAIDLRLDGIAQDTGGAGVDLLRDIERVVGSAFADTLVAGDDTFELLGGAGDDRLVASEENETLVGGAGADRFVWQQLEDGSERGYGSSPSGFEQAFFADPLNFVDIVADFDAREDRIDLTSLGIAAIDLLLSGSSPDEVVIRLEPDPAFVIRLQLVGGSFSIADNILL